MGAIAVVLVGVVALSAIGFVAMLAKGSKSAWLALIPPAMLVAGHVINKQWRTSQQGIGTIKRPAMPLSLEQIKKSGPSALYNNDRAEKARALRARDAEEQEKFENHRAAPQLQRPPPSRPSRRDSCWRHINGGPVNICD